MLSKQKHVSTLPSYVAIINVILPNWIKKKKQNNPDKMEIKDELVLNGMTWAALGEIEYNTISAFKTSDSNMPGYYIVR